MREKVLRPMHMERIRKHIGLSGHCAPALQGHQTGACKLQERCQSQCRHCSWCWHVKWGQQQLPFVA